MSVRFPAPLAGRAQIYLSTHLIHDGRIRGRLMAAATESLDAMPTKALVQISTAMLSQAPQARSGMLAM